MHGYEDPFAHRVPFTVPSSEEEVSHGPDVADADLTIVDADPPTVEDDLGADTLEAFAKDLLLGRREALYSHNPAHRLRRVGESRP